MSHHASSADSFRQPAADPRLWPLDPAITFLNHGSFGSCPRAVLEHQTALRDRLERQPVKFLVREFETLWDEARRAVARFVNAAEDDLVFVPNATSGVNTVLRSLRFRAGDELLVVDHEYNACRTALDFAADRAGARVVVARVPFPVAHEDEVVEAVLGAATARTRLALLDHVTSQTAMVMPIQRLVRELAARGVDTLVDGAHAPGMVPLDLRALGAAYYTGNCHKWLCAPKAAAFLVVRKDRQDLIHPLTISHGANSSRTDRSRFLLEFGWMGTSDPSACLSVAEAIRVVGSLLPGGWGEVMSRNRQLALAARRLLAEALRVAPPCPEAFVGSMASLPLPEAGRELSPQAPLFLDPLQDRLFHEHGIEVPVIAWPAPPRRLLRVSAHLYNCLPQYEFLAEKLAAMLG
ncbi:MAG TPA: aminotransferase class V-fold PLP-dependent enzyme [Methylomirabilota bacterium]|nr:aminotransferase class V-fold PLP-dependent enzyme [Methylomirabilota bacterium]